MLREIDGNLLADLEYVAKKLWDAHEMSMQNFVEQVNTRCPIVVEEEQVTIQ